MEVPRVCDTCGDKVSGDSGDCVIFGKPGSDERRMLRIHVDSYRCYPCDDEFLDKELEQCKPSPL